MLANPWEKLLRRQADIGFVAVFSLLMAAVGFAGYQRLFSTFAAYDDEGYVMVSLQQFMAGGALYDDVYSQYGPAYYWLASIFHRATDWPVTHDIMRLKTLFVWVSVAMLAAGWLYRVTRSKVIATIGFLFVSLHLERLAMEPGHPQELCVLAVAACFFLATFIKGQATDTRVVVAMALTTAVCLMTKVNVGLFLLLSMSAALLFATRPGLWRNALLGVVLLAMLALPVLVGRHDLFSWHGHRLPILLTTAIALTAWVATRTRMKPILELRHSFSFWGVVSCGTAIIAIGTLATGTSLAGLADGILLQHMSFVNIHYHSPPLAAFAPLAALLAAFVTRGALAGSKMLLVARAIATVLVITAVVQHLIETFHPLYHGSQDRGQTGLLVSYFVAYTWIILLPLRIEDDGGSTPRAESYFARLSLCLIAVLQPLIAHPVPGTQMAIGSIALVVVLLMAVHDGVETFRLEGRFAGLASRSLTPMLVGLLLIAVVCRDSYLLSERSRMPSLGLAGAERLRLPEEIGEKERWTVEQLRERADTFVCLPSGHNSLYLWSGLAPPTGFNATVWQDLLTDGHQSQIVAAIDGRERVCVVVENDEAQSLRTDGVLLEFIRANFHPVATYGSREIWERGSPTRRFTSDVKLGNKRAL